MSEPNACPYVKHYDLTDHPFGTDCDPRYFIATPNFRRALEILHYAIDADHWSVITGPSGVGKSTLLKMFESEALEYEWAFTLVDGKAIGSVSPLVGLAEAWREELSAAQPQEILGALRRSVLSRTNQFGNVIVGFDHIENMDDGALEDLMCLLELSQDIPLFHVVVAGDEVVLAAFEASVEALNRQSDSQRSVLRCHLEPMSACETEQYVAFRLAIAGWAQYPRITRDAWREIFGVSKGLPLKLHEQLDRLMTAAAQSSHTVVDAALVRANLERVVDTTKPGGPHPEQPTTNNEVSSYLLPTYAAVKTAADVDEGDGPGTHASELGAKQMVVLEEDESAPV